MSTETTSGARMNLGLRLVNALMGRTLRSPMSEEEYIAMQSRPALRHNWAIDVLLGGLVKGVATWDDTVSGEDGSIPVRVYRPEAAEADLPLIVFFHGGGWATGSLTVYDYLSSTLAARVGAVVVSVDYRLAPRHRWPAAVEDCWAAFVESSTRAGEWGADRSRIAVVGDSAGGNLAAVVASMSRDRGGPAIAVQCLIYPATDLTLESSSVEQNADGAILNKAKMAQFRDMYVREADRGDPYASPLLASSHAGLPPALIQVAELDPLRDDGLRYAQALRGAGVPVRSTTYVGMPHGFLAFPRISRSAPQALEELRDVLSRALAGIPAQNADHEPGMSRDEGSGAVTEV